MLFLNLMFNLPIPLFFSFLSVTTASTSTCCFQISGLAHSLVSLPQKPQIAWLPSLAQASPLSQPQLPAFVNKPWLAWTRSSVPVFCIRISWPALSQSALASEWGMSGNRYWLWKCSLSHSKYPGWRGSATSPSHLNLPKYSCCSPPVSVYPASLSCPRLWSTAAVGPVSLLKSLRLFFLLWPHDADLASSPYHYFLTLSAERVWNNEPLQIIFQNSPNDAFLNELVRQNCP